MPELTPPPPLSDKPSTPEDTTPDPKAAAPTGQTDGAASGAAAASPASSAVPAAANPRVDPELIVERALKAEWEAQEKAKAVDARLSKHAAIVELLEKADTTDEDVVEALLKSRGKFSEDFLYRFAKKFGDPAELTEEQKLEKLVEDKLTAKEKARIEAEEASRKAREEKEAAEGLEQLKLHLAGAAELLNSQYTAGNLKALKALGASETRYRQLLAEALDKGDENPDPLKIYATMNTEAEGRLREAGLLPSEAGTAQAATETPAATKEPEVGSLEEHAAKVFKLHKPKNFKPDAAAKVDPFEEAREKLRQYDAENKNRVNGARA